MWCFLMRQRRCYSKSLFAAITQSTRSLRRVIKLQNFAVMWIAFLARINSQFYFSYDCETSYPSAPINERIGKAFLLLYLIVLTWNS